MKVSFAYHPRFFSKIIIKGTTGNSDRFTVDLLKKGAKQNVFHMSNWYANDIIVFNTFNASGWEKEEKLEENRSFQVGQPFELEIVRGEEGYDIKVDGQFLYQFKHRYDYFLANVLEIDGDVNVEEVSLN